MRCQLLLVKLDPWLFSEDPSGVSSNNERADYQASWNDLQHFFRRAPLTPGQHNSVGPGPSAVVDSTSCM